MPKTDKDPLKPKGRMTAYAFFVQAQRDHLKKTEPDKNVEFKLFSKACSCDWKSIPDKEKMKFEALAQADKVRYDREMAAYVPPDDCHGKKKGKKKSKDPNAPKRGMSGFLFYCSERRPELKKQNPEWGMSDLSRALGDEWRAFSEEQKAPYVERAAADKERYSQQMSCYKKGEAWSGDAHYQPQGHQAHHHHQPPPQQHHHHHHQQQQQAHHHHHHAAHGHGHGH